MLKTLDFTNLHREDRCLAQTAQRWSSGKRRTLIATGLLVALGYILVAVLTDSARLADALRELGFTGCGAVLGLSTLNYLVRFHRWQHYLALLGNSLPAGRHLLVYLSGFAFTVSPAKAGEAVRSLYLRDQGVTYGQSIGALFVERLMDLLAIVMLASLMVVDHATFRPLVMATLAALSAVILGVRLPFVVDWLQRIGEHVGGRIQRIAAALAELLRSSRRLMVPRTLLFALCLGLVAWAAEGFGFYLICRGLGIHGSIVNFTGIYALAVLAGSVAFFLPAGIGGMELVMTGLLVERGATLKEAIIATLLCRLATLWFAVLVGVAAAVSLEASAKQLRPGLSP